MLNFKVYKDGKVLENWPVVVNTKAFCVYLADKEKRPQEKSIDFDYGRLICYCPDNVERRLFLCYHVKDFGDPILHTRSLQTGSKIYNLSVELALGRIESIQEEINKLLLQKNVISDMLYNKIEKAMNLARQAEELDASDRLKAADFAEESLKISVPTGEELALEVAEYKMHELIVNGNTKDFLLGTNSFGLGSDDKVKNYFYKAFNFATLPFYLSSVEVEPNVVEHQNLLILANELKDKGVKLKGHPLIWTFTPTTPKYYHGCDYDTLYRVFQDRILRDVPPFAEHIEYWDIINEAHSVPWANSAALTSEQFVDITYMAAETTRKVAPNSKLIINICVPFGEYTAGASGRVTPIEYIRSCIEKGVDFDIIGIQFYYGSGEYQYCWDMLEISKLLDEYCSFGKEIHITELGTPSQMGMDPNAHIKMGNEVGLWHNEWNEFTQADWLELFYKICISKNLIKAITWWDYCGERPFWPYGFLLNDENEPKQAYLRLLDIKNKIKASKALV